MEQTRSIDGGLDVPALREVWDQQGVVEQLREGRGLSRLLARSAHSTAARRRAGRSTRRCSSIRRIRLALRLARELDPPEPRDQQHFTIELR